jgi:hypothetical protein
MSRLHTQEDSIISFHNHYDLKSRENTLVFIGVQVEFVSSPCMFVAHKKNSYVLLRSLFERPKWDASSYPSLYLYTGFDLSDHLNMKELCLLGRSDMQFVEKRSKVSPPSSGLTSKPNKKRSLPPALLLGLLINPGEMAVYSPKYMFTFNEQYAIISQKTDLFISTSVNTANPELCHFL